MSKRSNGEGSVRQRPNGTWEGRVSYIDPTTDKRRSTSVYAATAKDCRAKLKAIMERIEDGRPARDAKMTVGSWLKLWRETSLPASPRKPSTRELYALLAKKHLEQGPIADVTLDKLKPTHVEALLVRLRENGLGDTSVRNIYGVLRAALDVAVRDDLLAANPAAKVQRPGVAKKEAAYLPTTDVARLLGELDGLRYGLGYSINPKARIAFHRRMENWWRDRVVRCDVEWFPSATEAAEAELQAITRHQPKFNRAGVTRHYNPPAGTAGWREIAVPSIKRAPESAPHVPRGLEDLVQAQRQVEASKIAVEDAKETRDDAIRAALADGVSPMKLAAWASMTRARIYQVRDRRR